MHHNWFAGVAEQIQQEGIATLALGDDGLVHEPAGDAHHLLDLGSKQNQTVLGQRHVETLQVFEMSVQQSYDVENEGGG